MYFCSSYSLSAFPLSESVLCRFVALLFSEGLSYSTIRQYLSATRYHQLMEGGPDPSYHSLHSLHYVLQVVADHSLPTAVCLPRLPITPAILRLLYKCWSHYVDDYDTVSMWAVCCTAFFGFLRSGEFTCQWGSSHNQSVQCLQDVAIDNRDNPSVLYVSLRHSKTDIFGAGVTIYLGQTGDILCPISAHLANLARRPSYHWPTLTSVWKPIVLSVANIQSVPNP